MLVATMLSVAACKDTENDSNGSHELAQDIESQDNVIFHSDSNTGYADNDGPRGGTADDNISTPAFARNVAESSMLEVQLGQLAQQNASNVEVKRFGQMMVKAHSALNQELKGLAEGNGIDMPTRLSQQWMNKFTELSRLKGVEFDRTYAQLMVDSHQKTIQLLMDYSEKTGPLTVDGSPSVTGTPQGGNTAAGSGTSRDNNRAATAGTSGGTDAKNEQPTMPANDFRSWAVKNIPTLQLHLEEAQRVKTAVTTNVTRKGDELTSERPSNDQQNGAKRQK
ncbi:hypothetical protein GCM10027291_53230 [Telluribacter humicola]